MQPESTIVELVHAWFSAATRGDASIIDRYVSTQPATRLVGSDPDEWLQGGEQIAAFPRSEVESAAGAVRFEPFETEAFAKGDVGWAATKLTSHSPTASALPLGGPLCWCARTRSGNSCRHTRQSPFRMTRLAGPTTNPLAGPRPIHETCGVASRTSEGCSLS
jgi:hypothetical protein